jgi:hypothetical protein
MSGFTIPNTPDAYNQNQAEPDSLDFQILGDQRYGVISGMGVINPLSAGTVDVEAGVILINGQQHSFAGIQGVQLTAYASAPFFDVVVARHDGNGNIAIAVVSGVTVNPRYPTIDRTTDVVLATVWRDNSGLTAAHITDKRFFVRANSNYVEPGDPDPARGSTGDFWVKSNWTAGSSLDSPVSVKIGASYINLARWSGTENIITTGSFTGANLTLSGNANINRVIPDSNVGTGSPVRVWGVTAEGDNTLRAYPTASLNVNNAFALANSVLTLTRATDQGTSSPQAGWITNGAFYISGTGLRYSFTPDTNTGIGNTSTQGQVSVYNNGAIRALFTNSGLTVYGSVTESSSLRYKDNVQDLNFNAKDLLKVRLVTFRLTNSVHSQYTGLIAEELDKLEGGKPFVTYDEAGRPDGINYAQLAVAYIELLKDHEARLSALEAK